MHNVTQGRLIHPLKKKKLPLLHSFCKVGMIIAPAFSVVSRLNEIMLMTIPCDIRTNYLKAAFIFLLSNKHNINILVIII